MEIYRTLTIPILLCILCTGTVSAAEDPSAPIEGFEEFVGWLSDLGRALIDMFQDAMEMIGLGDETYVGEMIETLEDGMEMINLTMDS